MIKIAIVEDDKNYIATLKEYISRLVKENRVAIELDVFRDGNKVVFHYQPVYDIILMDIEMPGMDGMTEAEQIRRTDQDVSKRIIQVAVFYEKSLLMIHVRNYCEEKQKFRNGLPVSTKKDKNYHGFGLKSIQYTAEKYGGRVVCQNPDNYFVLQILLPIPGDVKCSLY